MEDILFDPKGANSLNRLIQAKVSPHLFVICNYNPSIIDLISNDSKFLLGIANLYKFCVDTSLLNKFNTIDNNLGGTIKRKYRKNIDVLNKCIDIISTLRTYAFHNNNYNDVSEKYNAWVVKIIHKNKFENIDDYNVALDELEKIGDVLYREAYNIVTYMSKEYTMERLCEEFQAQIVQFYKNNDKIIKDELREAYRVRNNIRDLVKNVSIAEWCKKMYVGGLNDQIALLTSYVSKGKGNEQAKLIDRIKEMNSKIDLINKKVAERSNKCKGNIAQISNLDYLDYYCYDVAERCLSIIHDLKKQKLSMLPQDMIQYIIDLDFKQVPIDNY